jgi:hypothetical protein
VGSGSAGPEHACSWAQSQAQSSVSSSSVGRGCLQAIKEHACSNPDTPTRLRVCAPRQSHCYAQELGWVGRLTPASEAEGVGCGYPGVDATVPPAADAPVRWVGRGGVKPGKGRGRCTCSARAARIAAPADRTVPAPLVAKEARQPCSSFGPAPKPERGPAAGLHRPAGPPKRCRWRHPLAVPQRRSAPWRHSAAANADG